MFLLSLFWPPPFSIYLSLSLSCSCPFSSFLSFFFAFFWFLVFVSFFPFLSSLLLFMKGTTSKYYSAKFFFINVFSLFWFPVLIFLSNPFFLSLFFLDFNLVFFVQCFWFQKHQVEKHHFLVKRGVATKRFFFMSLCFAKCEKVLVFLAIFCKFWLMFKKHYKIGISAHFKKQQKQNNYHFQSY